MLNLLAYAARLSSIKIITRKDNRMKKLTLLLAVLLFSTASHAFVLGPSVPGKWGPGPAGTGATVSWSLMGSGISCDGSFEAVGCTTTSLASFMPTGWKAELEAAFAAWSSVADLVFVEVADSGDAMGADAPGTSGDIRIAGHLFDGPSGTLAHGYYPPANGGTTAGDIHFDTTEAWKIGFGGSGIDIFQVFAHELGHALGLGHEPTTGETALMNPFYTEAFSGPQADDIAGMVALYGEPDTGPTPTPTPGSILLIAAGLLGLRFAKQKKA